MKRYLFLVLAGCASSHAVRFANTPVVTVVDDRRDVPQKPAAREFFPDLYDFDATFHRPVIRALDVQRHHRALGVNALDEVPDSTWFTNRIGIRDLTADEMRAGPIHHDSPELHTPWTIQSTKIGGTSLGLIVKDKAGGKYLVKFDMKGFPEIETSSDVIVDRLLWACGFNVPEDLIVTFDPKDLVLPDDAKVAGSKKHLTRAELDKSLAEVEHLPDGRIRALASRWLDGKPIGGHAAEGTRDDDPNDRIPHELRRDLRGARTMFAWLDHLDIKEGNFLDMWVEEDHHHFVEHYLVDFGRSLGAGAMFGSDLRAGFSYVFDFSQIGATLFSFGLDDRPWEHRHATKLRGLGLYDAATFKPDDWKPAYPAYTPLLVADRFDELWAAKIIHRFTREQIHAAVEAGQLSDPQAVEYLTDVIVKRQQIAVQHAFEHASPLDHFTVTDGSLAFDDLAGAADYHLAAYDRSGHALAAATTARADAAGHVVTPMPCASDGDGYTVVRIEARGLEIQVHVARDPVTHAPRVIGIYRL